jgi:hypothetical protein
LTVEIPEGSDLLDASSPTGFKPGTQSSLMTTCSGPSILGFLGTVVDVELRKQSPKPTQLEGPSV